MKDSLRLAKIYTEMNSTSINTIHVLRLPGHSLNSSVMYWA